jgi:hypothetical protein
VHNTRARVVEVDKCFPEFRPFVTHAIEGINQTVSQRSRYRFAFVVPDNASAMQISVVVGAQLGFPFPVALLTDAKAAPCTTFPTFESSSASSAVFAVTWASEYPTLALWNRSCKDNSRESRGEAAGKLNIYLRPVLRKR